jgi:hypothetical protein
MVKILTIAYGTSWKLKKTSWKKKAQQVMLGMSKSG